MPEGFKKFEKGGDVPAEEKTEPVKRPIERGETFNPEGELLAIRKLPAAEKKQKLAEFKEKLAYQKEGLAKLRQEIFDALHENLDLPADEIKNIGAEYLDVYGFSPGQVNEMLTLLGYFGKEREQIKK